MRKEIFEKFEQSRASSASTFLPRVSRPGDLQLAQILKYLRDAFIYVLAEFVRQGGPPPLLTENQSEKKKVFFLSGKGGYPPPLTESQWEKKKVFFLRGKGGSPPPPLTDEFR